LISLTSCFIWFAWLGPVTLTDPLPVVYLFSWIANSYEISLKGKISSNFPRLSLSNLFAANSLSWLSLSGYFTGLPLELAVVSEVVL